MNKCSKYTADIIVMSTIFIVILLYIFDYIIPILLKTPSYPRWGVHHFHLIKDYLLECILWYILFWKSFRLGACNYTWIALISYGILILSWLSYYIFLFPYKIIQIIEFVTLGLGMTGMIVTYLIQRLCYWKFGK